MCLAVHRYAKANNKYVKGYNPSTRSSSHVLGCQQFIWMGNVIKVACGQFQVEKELTQKCIQNYDAESDKKKNNQLSQAYTEDTQ